MVKNIYSFFSNAHTDETKILYILVITSFFAGIVLGSLNYFLHNINDASVGLILSLFSLLIFGLLFRQSVKIDVLVNITLFFFLLFFLAGFITTDNKLEMVMFLVIYPIPVILLRPFKHALYWIIFYIAIVLLLFSFSQTKIELSTYEVFQLLLIQSIITMLLGYYVFSMKLTGARLKRETYKLSKLTETLEEKVSERTSDLNKKTSELEQAHWKLDQYKNRLEKRVQEEMQNVSEKEVLLKEQSRMAAIGEMVDAIAHQWKQPLNAISMAADMIKSEESKTMSSKCLEVNEMSEIIHNQIEHMTSTLSEFRSFFRTSKECTEFSLEACISSVKVLLKDELIKNTIEIQQSEQKDILINGYENEFKHLLLNLINNAKDAFNEKNIKKRIIALGYIESEHHITLQVVDNAGGIPESIIKDIFNPNITTKADTGGTGIGLYMSSQIAQKHHGKLSVQNTKDGARFTLTIKK
ncbi:HAMP domain-containing histidine kinase [Sulfurimonas sp. MAG313]|nr:HAMP domain-containing sensor histidine kinase [Sulfurimonas sp. MAG313]MDF1881227.1 HAMP domain-containing histidine kinase [Sulfurimonas sp. MAG313]